MRFLGSGGLLFFLLSVFCRSLSAQGISAFSSEAPTAFSSRADLQTKEEASEALKQNSHLFLKDGGGVGKFQSITSRGAPSNNTAVTLEGIPLTSSSSGAFDFAEINPFGLDEAEILRGPYVLQSSKPGAQVLLRLPQDEKYESSISLGSYSAREFKQRLPHFVFTYEQAENNFVYYDRVSGAESTRTHNFGRRMNARAWQRSQNYQIWAQLLYSSQQLPGSTLFPSPNADSSSIFPTIAGQFRLPQNFEIATWAQYRHETFNDPALPNSSKNRSFVLGARVLKNIFISDNFKFEQSLQFTEEKLFSHQDQGFAKHDFNSPYRTSISYAAGVDWSNPRGDLLQPKFRMEYIHPFKDAWSPHFGLSGKHPITDAIDLKWNAQTVSRAPTFYEMYFEFPGQSIPNPHLKRQSSYQSDFGYQGKWHLFGSLSLELGQSLYIDRTEDLILSTDIGGNIYQPRNKGVSIAYGLENDLHLKILPWFDFPASYRFAKTSVAGRSRPYEPTHLLTLTPELFPQSVCSVGFPIYFRSEVPTSSPTAKRIGNQLDFGAQFKSRFAKSSFQLSIHNLLSWRREEVEGYPLPQEPWMKASFNYEF